MITTRTIPPVMATQIFSAHEVRTLIDAHQANDSAVKVPAGALADVVRILDAVAAFSNSPRLGDALAKLFGPDVHRSEIITWADALAGHLARQVLHQLPPAPLPGETAR